MTPTEQDKELREKIHMQIVSCEQDGYGMAAGYKSTNGKRYSSRVDFHTDSIMQLITADRKRVALEARIDELKSLPVNWESCYDNTLSKHYSKVYDDVYNRRLDELKAQQEEV